MAKHIADDVLRSALKRIAEAQREVRAILDTQESDSGNAARMSPRDAYAAMKRGEGATFKEIGEDLGLSANRARALVLRAHKLFEQAKAEGWPSEASQLVVELEVDKATRFYRTQWESWKKRAQAAEAEAKRLKEQLAEARKELRERPARLVDRGSSEAYTALEHEYMERVGALRAEIQELKDRLGE